MILFLHRYNFLFFSTQANRKKY